MFTRTPPSPLVEKIEEAQHHSRRPQTLDEYADALSAARLLLLEAQDAEAVAVEAREMAESWVAWLRRGIAIKLGLEDQ